MAHALRSPAVLVLSIVSIAAAAGLQALPARGETPDPCGNPTLVSQGYQSHQGTVVEVLDPVTLLVEIPKTSSRFAPFPGCTSRGCRVKVRLVNLDAPAEPAAAAAAREALAKATLSWTVRLSLSSVQETPGVTNALATVIDQGTFRDVNREQLAAGHATYHSFGAYAVDWYTECQLERAQDQAREAGRGVWAKP